MTQRGIRALGATTVTSTLLGALRTRTDVIAPTRRYLLAEGDGACHGSELISTRYPRPQPITERDTAVMIGMTRSWDNTRCHAVGHLASLGGR